MRVYGLQTDIAWEAKADNFAHFRDWLSTIAPAPGSLIVLPEMAATGFSMQVDAIAETEDRPTEQFLAAIARDTDCVAIGGVVNRAADGKGLNQALAIAPDGHELLRYTKLYPFSLGTEHQHFQRGDDLGLFTWQGLPTAVFICYDLRFPEAFRAAVRRGIELFVVIANWPRARAHHWRILLQARAIENQAYVLGVNRVGNDPHLAYQGDSLLIDPRGDLVADGGSAEGWIEGLVDRDLVRACRRGFPALNDLREEFLGPR